MQEDIIICHRLLDQLDEEERFRRVHDRVHSLLKGLHGIESSEVLADEDDDAMTPLSHWQALDGEEAFIFLDSSAAEYVLEDDNVIRCLRKFVEKLSVVGSCVDFVSKLVESSLGVVEQVGGGKPHESGLVVWR